MGPPSQQPDPDRLLSLLERWQDLRQRGVIATAAEVCADCPDLAGELEKLARFDGRLRSLGEDAPPEACDRPASFVCARGHRWEAAFNADTLAGEPPCPQCAAPSVLSREGSRAGGPPPPARTIPQATVPPSAEWPSLPGYQILGELGRGGMGVVYKAHHLALGRVVALKVLLAPAHAGPQQLARFRGEAQALATLHHPHIVQIFEVGEHQGCLYLALELIEGASLESAGFGRLEPGEAARLVLLLARAVTHAHQRGVIHRDIKPGNVLLAPPADEPALNTSLGCPKVVDFGLARRTGVDQRLTASGVVMGTPAYMAPEQAQGTAEVGAPADVWALGTILYRLLAGREPFATASLADLLHRICHAPPPPLRRDRPDVPPALEAIIFRCLAKRPQDRPTALELVPLLEGFLSGSTTAVIPRRRWTIAAIAAGVLLAAVAALPTASRWLGPPPTWEERVRAMSPDDAVAAVIEELAQRNPGFTAQEHFPDDPDGPGKTAKYEVTDGEVTGLAVFTDEVTDLTPLTALPRLKHLSLRSKGYANGRLEDIGPLRHLRHLEKVSVAGTAVEDITPLAGLRLIGLNLFGTRVRDLSPLRGMPLNYLFIYSTPVTDLSPLAGMKMEGFSYDFTKIDRARALDLLRFLRDEMTIYREINDIAVAKVWKRLEAGEIP